MRHFRSLHRQKGFVWWIPAAITLFSGVMNYMGKREEGKALEEAAKRKQQAAAFKATQLRTNANQAMAASQRTAYFKGKEGDLVASRLQALAAAGGGGTDPTVMNLMANVLAQKSYNQSMALYEGEEKKRLLETQAQTEEYQAALGVEDASAAKSAYDLAATASLFGSASSLYANYGSGMPT